MDREKYIALMALLSGPFAIHPLYGAFDQFGKDARPSGMGEAFVGVADDVSALYYNPAGLTQIQGRALSLQLSQIVEGLDDDSTVKTNSLGFIQPLKDGRWGVLGFSYTNYKASSLAGERLLLASYARRLFVGSWEGNWSVGGNLKNMRREYEADRFTDNALNNVGVGSGQADPLLARNGFSKDVMAVDLGALYQFGPRNKYSFGFSMANINRPDVSLGGSGDKAPVTGRLGLVTRLSWGLLSTEFRRTERLASQQDSEIAIGVERNLSLAGHGNMVFRSGYVQGSRNANSVTAGLSFHLSTVQLDYGFNFPRGELTEVGGTHRVGFSIDFGRSQQRVESASIHTQEKPGSKTSLVDFSSSFQSAHFMLDRVSVAKGLTAEERNQFVNLLKKKYMEYSDQSQDWESLKKSLGHGIEDEEIGYAHAALEYWLIGNEQYTLTFLGLLSPKSKGLSAVIALKAISLTELAAKAYRNDQMEICIGRMREVLTLVPQDNEVSQAYRQLLDKHSTKLAAAGQ